MKRQILILFSCLSTVCVTGQSKLDFNDYPLSGNYTILSKEAAASVFAEIQQSPILEYRYTRGGCDYRAHAVYTLLKKKGIKTFKIWHFAASKIFLGGKDFNTHNLLLRVKDQMNLLTSGSVYSSCNINVEDYVSWGYHVAPVLLVQNSSKIDTMVVDPALFKNPIAYKAWAAMQVQPGGSSYFTFLDGNLISFQTESQFQVNGNNCRDCSGNNIITGVFFTDEYSIEQKWVESSISKGKIYVEYYENEIVPLEKELARYAGNPSDLRVQELACRLATKKKLISTESDIKLLPAEYQSRFAQYVDAATNILFK